METNKEIKALTSSDSDRRGLDGGLLVVGVGWIGGEVLRVVDDGDEQGAARAPGDLLAEAEVLLGDLKHVAAGAGVGEGLQLLAPLHVLDLHIVVRHLEFDLQSLRLLEETLPRQREEDRACIIYGFGEAVVKMPRIMDGPDWFRSGDDHTKMAIGSGYQHLTEPEFDRTINSTSFLVERAIDLLLTI